MPITYSIIYDGSCNFCRCCIAFLDMFNPRGRLIFVDLHDSSAMRQFPQVNRSQAMESVTVIASDGRQAHGYDGIVMILEAWRGTGILRWIMRLRLIRWFGRKTYHLVSKYRYHIKWLPSCGTQCRMRKTNPC